jgi:hypothetical protein
MASEMVLVRYERGQLGLLELPFSPLVLSHIESGFEHACFGRLDLGRGEMEMEGVKLQVLDGASAASPNMVIAC